MDEVKPATASHGPRMKMPTAPKRKSKSKSKPSKAKRPTKERKELQVRTQDDLDSQDPESISEVDQSSNLDKSIIGKKQKEMPKPVIPIYFHHAFPFKNQEILRKRTQPGEDDDKTQYKLLKHIIGQEKAEWDDIPSHPSYWTIKAPPRLKPAKKYSDISGFEAKYTDPETKLHYCDAEEFDICRSLTRDLVQSYLRLRGYVDIIG